MDKKMSGFVEGKIQSAQTQHKLAHRSPCMSLSVPNAENSLPNPLILGFAEFRILSFFDFLGHFSKKEKWGD